MSKQTIDDLAIVLTGDSRGLATALKQAEKELRGFRKHVEGASKPPATPSWAKSAAAEYRTLNRVAREAGGGLMGFMGKVVATGGTLVAAEFAVTGLADAFGQLKDSVNLAAEAEQTHLAFEVMLGDARQAKAMVADIRKFASTTPFNTRELTGAAKQLISYGVAADNVMPTLKMLGDVSAAFGQDLPIHDLVYLYGTLYSQRRAYQKDINQFTGRGVPILDELAAVTGKSVAELRVMTEEGRIGIDEVTKAFVRMTSAGGRFYQMTARQGETFAGRWEAMLDAVQMAKMKLGVVVIEEMGLRDAADDFGAWTKRVEDGLDRIRPAVRLTGDIIKGLAQNANEFGRVFVEAVTNGSGAFATAFPRTSALLRDLRAMIADAQDFRLDQEQVIRWGSLLAEEGGAALIELTADAARLGVMLHDDVGKPLVDAFRQARDEFRLLILMMEELNRHVPEKNKFLLGALPAFIWKEAELEAERQRRLLQLDPVPAGKGFQPLEATPKEFRRFDPQFRFLLAGAPGQADVRAQAKRAWEHRLKMEAMLRADPQNPMRQREALLARVWEEDFLAQFEGPPEAVRHMFLNPDAADVMGRFPALRPDAVPQMSPAGVRPGGVDVRDQIPGWQPAPQGPQEPAGLRAMREIAKKNPNDWRAVVRARRDLALQDLFDTRAADAAREFAAAVGFAADRLDDLGRSAVAAAAGGPGLGALLGSKAEADQRAAVAAAGGPALGFGLDAAWKDRVKLLGGPPQDLVEDAKRIREDLDPTIGLNREKARLDRMVEFELLKPDEAARQWQAEVRRAADHLGVGGPYQLPDAVEVGSQEDARIVNQWRAGVNQPQTTEQLLKAILQVLEQQKALAARMAGNPQPEPFRIFGLTF